MCGTRLLDLNGMAKLGMREHICGRPQGRTYHYVCRTTVASVWSRQIVPLATNNIEHCISEPKQRHSWPNIDVEKPCSSEDNLFAMIPREGLEDKHIGTSH